MPEKPLEQAVCARCGKHVDFADHFVVESADRQKRASICRSEHIAAWIMRGAAWQLERPWEESEAERAASGPVHLVRVRAGQRIERDFDSPEQLRKWAGAGGFWSAD